MVSLFSQGMCVGGYGPAVVNLEILLDTDLKTLGASMVAGSAGYLLGSLIGGVLVDRINQEFLFASAALFEAVTFALFPWALDVYMFAVFQFVKGVGAGVLDAGVFLLFVF